MRIPFELFVALRHLKSRKRERFISVATLICLVGVTLGVMALIVVLSVMNGFQETIKERILSLSAHILVLSHRGTIAEPEEVLEKLRDIEGIRSLSPMVLAQVMVSSPFSSSGAVLKGVRPDAPEILYLRERIAEGKGGLEPGEVWLGVELARLLGVRVGDRVQVLSPVALLHPFGRIPRIREVRVGAIFRSGMYDYDATLVLMPLDDVQGFLSLGHSVTHIAIRIEDIYRAHRLSTRIQQLLGGSFFCRDWMEMNRNLFYALRMERRVMFVLLSLVVAVASFNIIAVLMMTVMEKRREIAILRSMGAARSTIHRIFLLEGLLIGIGGTILGMIGGILLALNVQRISAAIEDLLGIQFLPPDVYYITEVPSKVSVSDVLWIAVLALGLSLLSALYPAWKASRLDPVEVLRYE